MNLRSHHVTQGVERVPHRSLLRATGLTEEEMNRPLIGVVSAYSEIIPGHINLDKIANAVKTGVSMAGGVFHNLGQLLVACLIMSNFKLMSYFAVLLFSGLISGILIGIVAAVLYDKLPHLNV